jgi:predicted glycosyl hydrolase (DUF1957 family)
MEQGPSEVDNQSPVQETPRPLRNPRVHYRAHTSLYLNLLHRIHDIHTQHIYEIMFNIILSSWLPLPFRTEVKIQCTFHISACVLHVHLSSSPRKLSLSYQPCIPQILFKKWSFHLFRDRHLLLLPHKLEFQ